MIKTHNVIKLFILFLFIFLPFITNVSAQICTDNDSDGFAIEGGSCGELDCDDADPNVYPGALEICDGKDTDCDGWKPPSDVDNDGDGSARCAGDCNDSSTSTFPGAPELCDGIDNNCDYMLRSDERDLDNDGYRLCDVNPDCNDYDASVNPGAFEICNDGIDNNCNGRADFDDQEFCVDICIDGDLDGYKDIDCGGSDCDDNDANIFPTDLGICDGLHSECSGFINLTWIAPTANMDGSALTDLAGYILYYSTSSYDYLESIDVGNITCHAITNLPQGTIYFVLTAYDTSGNESDFSDELSIDVEW